MNDEEFRNYWFGYMCILLLKDSPSLEGRDWREDILGTYYVRSSFLLWPLQPPQLLRPGRGEC